MEDLNQKLYAALAKAQGEIRPATLDKDNPYFKSRYASLGSVMEAIRGPLASQGLAISQALISQPGGYAVNTVITHMDGGVMHCGMVPLFFKTDKPGMQDLYAAATYARRLGICTALCIVADEDSDGNDTTGVDGSKEKKEAKAQEKKAEAKKSDPLPPVTPWKPGPADKAKLELVYMGCDWVKEEVIALMKSKFNKEFNQLTKTEFDQIIEEIQANPRKGDFK